MSDEVGTHAIELAGRRFAWRTVGRGPALLLVNGYAATSADWDPTLLDALGRSFRIVCPDNRGTGGSELGDPDQLSADAMAEDLEGLLDELDIERAPVVGWSMGGFVAQRLAARSPRRVCALVLLASAPGGPAGAPAEPHVLAKLTDHSGTPAEQATRLISLLFPPAVAVEVDRQFGAVVAAARAQLSPATLAAQERVLAAWSSEPQPAPGTGRAADARDLRRAGHRDSAAQLRRAGRSVVRSARRASARRRARLHGPAARARRTHDHLLPRAADHSSRR